MDEEDSVLLMMGFIAVLAVIGIVAGLTNSVTEFLVTVGVPLGAADQFGTILFFLILLGLVVFVLRRTL